MHLYLKNTKILLLQLGNDTSKEDSVTTESQQQIKSGFENLFVNSFQKSNFDDSKVKKLDNSKELVYNGLQYSDTKENLYEMNLNIPYINIDSDVAKGFNEQTQKIFVNEATKLSGQTTTTGYTIFNVNIISCLFLFNLISIDTVTIVEIY